jgi:hypothetical protein
MLSKRDRKKRKEKDNDPKEFLTRIGMSKSKGDTKKDGRRKFL